jgi:O-antigen/teichoic acid export membrane protein
MKQSNTLTRAINDYFHSVRHGLRNPLASDSAFLAASQYIAACVGFLKSIIAARLLGPTNFGIAALVIAYPTLLWSFASIKSASVTTRYIASSRATGRHKLGYCLDFMLSFVAFALVGVTGSWVSHSVYKMPQVFWLMFIYAASIPFSSLMGTSWAILSSWQRFHWLSILQILDKIIVLVLVLAFLLAGFGVPGMIIANAIGNVAIGIIMTIAATYVLHQDRFGFWWQASFKKLVPLFKELGGFFGWNYITVTLGGLLVQVPLILLGRLRGPQEAGFFRLATSVVTVGSYFETSLGRVTYPVLSARWAIGERENLKGTLKRWTLRGGIPLGVFVLFTIPFLPILIPMVFGVQVMVAGAALSGLFFWLNPFYFASGMIAAWTKGYALHTALVILLGWLFIQQWGFLGMAGIVTVGKAVFTVWMVGLIMAHGVIDSSYPIERKS